MFFHAHEHDKPKLHHLVKENEAQSLCFIPIDKLTVRLTLPFLWRLLPLHRLCDTCHAEWLHIEDERRKAKKLKRNGRATA